MIAGRGLGHTGGTLDKLESIPGMNVFLSSVEMSKQMKSLGGFFTGQTAEIAPLDKRLYAMRDVTDTVESIPLITASILSKKLSEGLGGLVMDVKFGSGAFMQKKEDALALAESIASVGRASGVQTTCLLTDMNSPLGDRAGNALEIEECVDILKGVGPRSTVDLTLSLAVEMLRLATPSTNVLELRSKFESHLASGRAFELFCKVIAAQGGRVDVIEDTSRLPKAKTIVDVCSDKDGFIEACDVRKLGLAIVELGGGRKKSTDKIDLSVGLSKLKRVGDAVKVGEPIARIHASSNEAASVCALSVRSAYKLGASPSSNPLIWRTI
jgi:pyrimidine-nucleoside phosphorylase